MWSANAQKQTGPNGLREIAVIFESDSGYGSITEHLAFNESMTQDIIAGFAKRRIEELNAQDAAYEALVDGPIVPKDVVPVPPTQDEIDRALFLEDYHLLQKLTASVESGLLAADDKLITDLRVQVKAQFKPEYGEFLG